MPFRRPRTAAVAVVLSVLAAVGCGSSRSVRGPVDPSAGARGPITVFAAASLTDAFTRLGADFEAAHPGTEVRLSFGASSALATQLAQGAPADVFAAADEATMARATAAGTVADPVVFATNSLAVLVAAGNPKAVRSVRDLARGDLVVVLAAPQVPLGGYTAEVLRKAGTTVVPRSLEPDAKAVVAKVVAGEADAGVVYRTDVSAAAGRAEGVTIPDDLDVTATYPIALATGSPNPGAARRFVAYVTGPEGRATLERFGFTPAP